jgi:hypothetical protein
MKTFLLYSDKGYERMVESFLISRKYAECENIPVLYYTVGFESKLDYPNLTKVRWEIDLKKINLNFSHYKPEIILNALNYADEICYMDSDVVLSKRFNINSLFNTELDYPLCSKGPLDFVWVWYQNQDEVFHVDEKNLMNYYGVNERSDVYLWASMMTYTEKCRDFIEEWSSISNNPFLLKNHQHYFPFYDETALNVTFWKRGCDQYLDLIFFNTVEFESFLKVETQDEFKQEFIDYAEYSLDDYRIYETCKNSSTVQFYHGLKLGENLDKVLNWMKSEMNKKELNLYS